MAHAIHSTDYLATDRDIGFVARLRSTLAKYREYRSVLNELSILTDRDLADLDLSRENLRDIAHRAVYVK